MKFSTVYNPELNSICDGSETPADAKALDEGVTSIVTSYDVNPVNEYGEYVDDGQYIEYGGMLYREGTKIMVDSDGTPREDGLKIKSRTAKKRACHTYYPITKDLIEGETDKAYRIIINYSPYVDENGQACQNMCEWVAKSICKPDPNNDQCILVPHYIYKLFSFQIKTYGEVGRKINI